MSETASNIWNLVLSDLQSSINKQTYDAWFKNTAVLSFSNDSITVKVQDDVAQRYISSSYSRLIGDILKKITGTTVNCQFVINDNMELKPTPKPVIVETSPEPVQAAQFNPYYTFENFVIGPNNQLAHAAALSVAKNPSSNYNPLFLYGESGLGKTHLLQAIGHHVAREKPYLKILYIKTEQFVNEFINSIMNNETASLKIKYRNVDILLIDDIQFLAEKEQTQIEFFHTFDELHSKRKQVVITSDRPPKEISHLTDRLRTRFMGGLLADIQLPNLETREAILRRKAEFLGISVPEDVINYIATRIKSNIRSLEAALNNIHHVSTILDNKPITLEMAKLHLKPLFEESQTRQLTVQDIIRKVSDRMNISAEMIVSKNRHNSIVMPRFIAIYISTQLTSLTTSEIGTAFGNRDHSTVINARKNIEQAIERDESIKELVYEIMEDLKN